jgi:hypothetical protein
MEPGDAPQSICHTNLISGRWSQWSVSGVSALSLSLRLHHGMACVSDLELEQSWT